MKTQVQHRLSFEVLDGDETLSMVNLYVELLEVTVAGGRSIVEGRKWLRLTDGQEVDRVASGRFRVRSSGKLLYCDPLSAHAACI